jgi:hypothetical protein
MTRKVYKSAMGKTVDLGALLLQNEQVRAVGNMGVNAAGDLIDSNNRVIEQRNKQIQKQYKRQTTNVTSSTVTSSNLSAKKNQTKDLDSFHLQSEPTVPSHNPVVNQKQADADQPKEVASGGLAAAIARNREIKQELEKTLRQRQQEQGIKPI